MAYAYTLDDPNWIKQNLGIPTDPTKLPGRLLEQWNYVVAMSDPNANFIDPKLKPMKQATFDLGFDYSLRSGLVLSVRYTDRRLIRTVEDIGTINEKGETYWIGNPGFGLSADPSYWGPRISLTPKATRYYDALEVRFDRHFSRKYQFTVVYMYSRLYGEYSGLASSDENGRTSPNVERNFDQPWLGYTEKGVLSAGLLATDRPNTLKLFGAYTLNSKLGATTFSPTVAWFSGTPLTTEAYLITTVPAYPYGRGDLGRTPQLFRANFNVIHDVRPFRGREDMRVRLEFTVFNLFNSATEMNRNVALLNPYDQYIQFATTADIFKGFNTRDLMAQHKIRVSPIYNWPSAFLPPRFLRFQVAFLF